MDRDDIIRAIELARRTAGGNFDSFVELLASTAGSSEEAVRDAFAPFQTAIAQDPSVSDRLFRVLNNDVAVGVFADRVLAGASSGSIDLGIDPGQLNTDVGRLAFANVLDAMEAASDPGDPIFTDDGVQEVIQTTFNDWMRSADAADIVADLRTMNAFTDDETYELLEEALDVDGFRDLAAELGVFSAQGLGSAITEDRLRPILERVVSGDLPVADIAQAYSDLRADPTDVDAYRRIIDSGIIAAGISAGLDAFLDNQEVRDGYELLTTALSEGPGAIASAWEQLLDGIQNSDALRELSPELQDFLVGTLDFFGGAIGDILNIGYMFGQAGWATAVDLGRARRGEAPGSGPADLSAGPPVSPVAYDPPSGGGRGELSIQFGGRLGGGSFSFGGGGDLTLDGSGLRGRFGPSTIGAGGARWQADATVPGGRFDASFSGAAGGLPRDDVIPFDARGAPESSGPRWREDV